MHAAIVRRTPMDRRKDRRMPVRAAVDLRVSGIAVALQATLDEISAGGCRLRLRLSLDRGQALRIELPQPGRAPLFITGNVLNLYGKAHEAQYAYGVRFRSDSADQRAAIANTLSLYARKKSLVYDRRRETDAVDVKMQCEIAIPGSGRVAATVLQLSLHGMRVTVPAVLRQEWNVKCDLRLPDGSIATFPANATPGARNVRGQFVQDLEFGELTVRARSALEELLYDVNSRA